MDERKQYQPAHLYTHTKIQIKSDFCDNWVCDVPIFSLDLERRLTSGFLRFTDHFQNFSKMMLCDKVNHESLHITLSVFEMTNNVECNLKKETIVSLILYELYGLT